jgi:hypothetical protein
MTRQDALRAVYDDVKAGKPNQNDGTLYRLFGDEWLNVWDVIQYPDGNVAVGAALAFIAATLPGVRFQVGTNDDGTAYATVIRRYDFLNQHSAYHANPATALLLAGLAALIAEQEAK